MSLEDVERALTDIGYGYRPSTAAVAIENTHNICGGTCLSPTYVKGVADLAHKHGTAAFCDGARLFNAAIAQDVTLSALTAPLDAVSISLNKAVGAPYGAILCGSKALIERARFHLRSLGGHSVHRAGMFAAAVLVGLKNVTAQISRDHMAARALGQALQEVSGIVVDVATLQTNIVRVKIEADWTAQEVTERLSLRGIGAGVLERDAIKFVTHREFDISQIPNVVEALKESLNPELSDRESMGASHER